MKVGLFSPYLDTMGGGERYFLTAAEFFLKRGDKVDLFWPDETIATEIKNRFDIDVSKANFVKSFRTLGYDVIFFLSDGSVPLSWAKKTIIHFQVPFTHIKNNLLTKWKLSRAIVVCNSVFTKHYIDETFSIKSKVIYPPVDVESFKPTRKENIILGVGRFFAPLHSKKQEVLIETFKRISSKMPDWSLVLIGGVTLGTRIDGLRNNSKGYAIEIIADTSVEELKKYYGKAKIFWHAAGFGENLNSHPEKAEHFGMTTVEAMAAGCVPIVFAGGGQKEIITNGVNGFLWKETTELAFKTIEVSKDDKLRDKIAQQAIQRSKLFSKEVFFQKLNEII